MNELRLTGPVELQAADAGKPKRFAMTAYSGGPMRLGGFGVPVVVDARGVSWPTMPAILRDHDATKIIGHATDIQVEKRTGEIRVEGVVSGTGEAAQEVLALAANGFPWQASIGAAVEKSEYVEAGQKIAVNGRTISGPATIVRAATLREVSFVPIGADSATSAAIAAQQSAVGGKGVRMNEFDAYVADLGLDPAAINDTQRTKLRAAFDADAKSKLAASGSNARAIRELAERNAFACPAAASDLKALALEALEAGWTADQYENKAMMAMLNAIGNGPNVTPRSRPNVTQDVLEASLLLQQGVPAKFLEGQYDQRTVDAAMGRDYRGIGLHSLCRLALQARGVSTGPGRLMESSLREALDVRASVGASTISVPGVLSNTMNKAMLAAFTDTPTTWGRFCRTSSVNDFKSATSYRLTAAGEIERIAAGGEVKHGTLSESSYSRQADQYGKLIGLDRKALINDDLGALQSVPGMLARMSATTLERAVYTTLLGNAGDFFHSSNGNNLTTGASALGDSGLTAAYKAMMELEDADGRPVLVVPKVLLVCPALWRTARSLTQSTGTNLTGDTDANFPDSNPWAGMFEVVASPYLGLSQGITNALDTLWYLLAGPGDFSIIDVHFLNGQRTPTVESFDMEANQLGLVFRVVFDFGVSFLEPKGGIRNAGA